MELWLFHMGLGGPFSGVKKLLKFCDWNWNLSFCTTVNVNIDLLIPLSSHQPDCSINRQDVRLKSSPISLRGLIGAEGQEMCMVLLVYCLYGSNTGSERVCVCEPWNNLLGVLLAFSISKPGIFIFSWYPQNKFKCLLSSSNQTVRDILEKKWNKMLCD